jgi:DNA-binding transcriptional ArsR family regulator
MQATRDWLAYFKDREQDHEDRLKSIESRLDEISEVLNMMQEAQEAPTQEVRPERGLVYIEEESEEPGDVNQKIVNDLTDTQKSIFYRLGTLLYESSQEWITTKALAQELYPDKAYDKVRSTLSEYTSILIEAGIVKKKRRGKLTYLSITSKGLSLFDQTKKTKLKKVLIKPRKEE